MRRSLGSPAPRAQLEAVGWRAHRIVCIDLVGADRGQLREAQFGAHPLGAIPSWAAILEQLAPTLGLRIGGIHGRREGSLCPTHAKPFDVLSQGRETGKLAERVGFEPTVEFPLHTLSKRAPSTIPGTLSPDP